MDWTLKVLEMPKCTKSPCRCSLSGESKGTTVGQPHRLPRAFGDTDYGSAASTAQPSSSGNNRWKINNELGINCSSEGPGGNSHGNSAAVVGAFSLWGIFLCPEAPAVVLGRGSCSLGTDLAQGELAVVGICAATAVNKHWKT